MGAKFHKQLVFSAFFLRISDEFTFNDMRSITHLGAYFRALNMVKWCFPEKGIQKVAQTRRPLVQLVCPEKCDQIKFRQKLGNQQRIISFYKKGAFVKRSNVQFSMHTLLT